RASSPTPSRTPARRRHAAPRRLRRRRLRRGCTASRRLAAAPPRLDTTPAVDRQRISSGTAFEQRVGYSRAVRVGSHVWVSGTAPIMPGDADPPEDAYG